jgi:phage terminase large subunit
MTSDIQIDISLKEQYLPLYESPKPINDLWGGRGRGGSHEATLYALYRLTRPDYCRIAFVRKILNDVRHSLWKDFLDRIAESNVNYDDFRIVGADGGNAMGATYYPTGNTVTCFGVKAEGGRTAKLKSLAGYNLVIIEECDELTEEEFNQLDDSLRTVKGNEQPMIIRVFNPPGRSHWLWKSYNLLESDNPTYLNWKKENPLGQSYWKAEPKQTVNLLSIFSTFRENVTNLASTKIEKWLGYLKSNPEYYFTIIEGLISEGQRGRIYSGWRPITFEQYKAIEAREIFGQDFGKVDPAANGSVKIVKNRVYVNELNYKPATEKELGILYCTLGLTGKDLIIGDKEDPIAINKIRNGWSKDSLTEKEIQLYPQLLKGFYILASIGGPGSIEFGIGAVKDLEVYVTEESINIWNEYRAYKWALDKDKNPTNTPEDKNNHHMDWIRNVVTARGRLF